ncbi:hypothetical protein SAMN05216483_6160 [Streptomyces sp. 2131.1]|nr:hypothetical protein SAMN05216483_6160 [Streptomyces sp. 2131.1]
MHLSSHARNIVMCAAALSLLTGCGAGHGAGGTVG